MPKVSQWTRFELELTSAIDYDNPIQDAEIIATFQSPNGRNLTVNGFWDGGRTWKIRFSPDETGQWTYVTHCSNTSDQGLNNQKGSFDCIPYSGDNPLYKHGAIHISDNRRYLIHSDGTPFLWLGDTAWNAVLLSTDTDWEKYLQDRTDKGFSVVQFVTTQWRAANGDIDGRLPYVGNEKIQINPSFYQRMDERMNVMNDYGIVGSPVLLWAISADTDPGMSLPDDQAILIARYMLARYASYRVIWILAGDGNYKGERAERWKKIGHAVFDGYSDQLATMHPQGMSWVADEFRHESWFSFNSYQSGHGDNDDTLRWLCEGPPSIDWKKEPHHPEINLEPNYEAHNAYQSRKPHDAKAVRRAGYWSLLVSPTAGLTYGAHGIWGWQTKPEEPLNHNGTGIAPPWYEAIKLPGSTHIKYMKEFFSSFEWWKLVPAPEMLIDQPGKSDPNKFVAVAKTDDNKCMVAYLTEGMEIALNTELIKRPALAKWFNPSTCEWSDAGVVNQSIQKFCPTDNNDWVLWIGTTL
jgi:hypothetical protein